MNIVHELNQLDIGGVERVIRNIVKFDKINKHTIVSYKDGPYHDALIEAGAKVIVSEGDKVYEDDIEMDVLHVHSGGGQSLMAKAYGKEFPVIETIHSPIRSPIASNLLFRRVGVTKAVSDMNVNAQTILNGIDFEQLIPSMDEKEVRAKHGLIKDIPVIGRLGRLGKDKGLEDFLLVCYYLQVAGLDFVPLIVGDEARDCDGYRGVLKVVAASLPVKNVIWVPATQTVSDYLQIMDVFLYPSLTEGFGYVFAEAMYNGCTVVAYETMVTREVVGPVGRLTYRSIPAMVAAVKQLIDPGNIFLVENKIHAHARAKMFEAERMSLEYQALYEEANHSEKGNANRPKEEENA